MGRSSKWLGNVTFNHIIRFRVSSAPQKTSRYFTHGSNPTGKEQFSKSCLRKEIESSTLPCRANRRDGRDEGKNIELSWRQFC
jgi:hypothetical protein